MLSQRVCQPHRPQFNLPPPTADRRIDLLKGLALGIVFVDHFEDALGVSLLSGWTLRGWGPSDAAEMFVWLSGLVVGRSTAVRLQRDGWWPTQRHALRRTAALYLGYLLAAVATLFVLQWHNLHLSAQFRPAASDWSGWWAAAVEAATLQRVPYGLQILIVYLQLLPLSPLIVQLLRRSLAGGLLAATVVYLWVQWDALTGDRNERFISAWYFQIASWQLLYVIGLAGGWLWSQRGDSAAISMPPRPMIAVAVLVVVGGWWLRSTATVPSANWLDSLPRDSRQIVMTLLDKRALGPLRLVHALAVAVLCGAILPAAWSIHLPAWLRPVSTCGRRSLLVYTCGVVLTVAIAGVVVRLGVEPGTVLLAELDVLILLAYLAHWRDWLAAAPTARDDAQFG